MTELAANTTDIMALLAAPFGPSYAVLKNLHQKLYKYITVTLVNLSLPIRL